MCMNSLCSRVRIRLGLYLVLYKLHKEADYGEAPAKDGSEEEAVDETAGGNGLFEDRRTEETA